MKRTLLVLAFFFAFSALLSTPSRHTAEAAESNSQSSPAVLCLAGIYMQDPGDCSPAGPSSYLTEMAKKGITFPLTALPASKPDPALSNVETNYGLVRTRNAPVYSSVEDALAGSKKAAPRRIDSGFAYISYQEDTVVDGRRFYMVEAGSWMTANDISRIGAVPRFQGLTFSRTPDRPFGWVLTYLSAAPVQTKRTPGNQTEDYTGHFLNNYDVVQVYSEEKVGDEEWYMVGPDEWVPHNVVARVLPNTTPPEGISGDRWIEVNLYEQTLAVYDKRQMVFATLIASGLEPFYTRPGIFQIQQKLDSTIMRGSFEADHSDAYYLEDVPWTMYYDDARALHGAYWRANLGFPQSHGCINMTVGDSHWLFNWANEGDWVHVWDPSGETPTDPKFYSSGGY